MSNVVAFPFADATPVIAQPDVTGQLLMTFGTYRKPLDDVFWLKENAELLGILAATNEVLAPDALDPFLSFYDQIEERLRFFPQYYRFLLSICLDLEDLGMPGAKGEALCAWVARAGLAEAELSDLQRAEARRLLARRGAARPPSSGALGARLQNFVARNATFAMPNKKAAYELTHIVFYLSEYGKTDPNLPQEALLSLEFAGVLAYLDQNFDLLAEVCAALRFAGQTPSDFWEDAVAAAHACILPTTENVQQDAYHAYLVTGWAQKISGNHGFTKSVPDGVVSFAMPAPYESTLRPMSECLINLGQARSGDWQKMRGHVLPYLGPHSHEVLMQAEASTDKFDAFFEGFARAASS
jgi:hypothetical protein